MDRGELDQDTIEEAVFTWICVCFLIPKNLLDHLWGDSCLWASRWIGSENQSSLIGMLIDKNIK